MSWCYIKKNKSIPPQLPYKHTEPFDHFIGGIIPLLQEVGKYARCPFSVKLNTAKILFQKTKRNPRFY